MSQTAAVPAPGGRIRTIDGLRAYAVGIVVLSHWFVAVIPGGGVGVDVFFVISGFVITRGLLADRAANGRIDILGFYRRRAWRLWPALWAVVAFATLMMTAAGHAFWMPALATLLSLVNWGRALGHGWYGPLDHTWSLAIEEQFYLLWPVCLIGLLKLRRHRSALLAAALAASMIWRWYLATHGASEARIYNGFDTRLDGLLLGCLIAVSGFRLPRSIARAWVLPVASLTCIVVYDRMSHWGYALSTLAAGWLVLSALSPSVSLTRLLENRVALWAGARSYSLYLWHFPVMFITEKLLLPASVAAIVYFAGSLITAKLSYRLVEQPFRHGPPRGIGLGMFARTRQSGNLAP